VTAQLDYDTYLAGETCGTCFDVNWLLRAGELSPVIAERMGRNREALQRHLRKCDPTLLARFNAAYYTDTERYHP
jgi:hypothetical protein